MADAQQIITAEVNRLNDISSRLAGLARAFARTGNSTVADEIDALSEDTAIAAATIHEAHYAQRMVETDQSIANSERFIGSILKGLIGGKDPKDACLEAMPHHFDRDIVEAQEAASRSLPHAGRV